MSVKPLATSQRHNFLVKIVAAAAAAAVFVTAVVSVFFSRVDVVVAIDGVSQPVSTWSGTVHEVLRGAGVEVGSRDAVIPALDTVVSDGAKIEVRSARQVQVTVGDEPRTIWSTALSSEDLLRDLALSGRTTTMAASRSGTRLPLQLLTTAGSVVVAVDGKESPVEVAEGAGPHEVLTAAEVEVSPLDQVKMTHSDGGIQIQVVRVSRGERVETEEIEFATVEREDDNLFKGQTRVVQAGAAGVKQRVFYEVLEDGQAAHSVLLSEAVLEEPVEQITVIGTREPTTRNQRASAGTDYQSYTPDAASGDAWARLAQCESSGNPNAVSRSGKYHGLYQFDDRTWASVGGSGHASDASPEEQNARAQELYNQRGWQPWGCARTVGLY